MTTDLDRRSFVQTGSALTAGAAVTAAIWPGSAATQTPSATPSGVKPMKFDVKPLPFDPKKIKGLSEKLLVSHYENNYAGAVKRLTTIVEQFAGLGDESQPGAALSEALARDFGSLDRWRAEFVAMGKAEGGGSGWVVLNWDRRDKRLVNAWAADHTTTLAGGYPILVLDMYEHAYHMDYGAKAGDYVEAFMHAIRWSNADSLYAQYSRA